MLGYGRYVAVLALAVAAVCLATGPAGAAGMPSWTQYQGDAAHSGYVPATVDASKITPLWSLTKTQLGQSSLIPGAVTDPSFVYVSAFKSGSTYQVLALNKTTGATAWSRDFAPYALEGLSAPSTGNGKVYVHQ